ncbi:MAG TPA: hypothetical protein PLW35_02935 [Verrucomicrobiota bacterium]|nr:hypothetical protein [Verrucomicrobiota bacterium]
MYSIDTFAGAFGCQGTKWRRSDRFDRGGPCTESGGFQFGIIAPHAWSVRSEAALKVIIHSRPTPDGLRNRVTCRLTEISPD